MIQEMPFELVEPSINGRSLVFICILNLISFDVWGGILCVSTYNLSCNIQILSEENINSSLCFQLSFAAFRISLFMPFEIKMA